MTKPAQILQIDPPHELVFKGPFTDVITINITLTNPSDRTVCFKVKTTAPKQYCVRPNSGTIAPKGNVKVAVMLQPFDYNAEEKSKHKFMVQAAFLPDNETSADNIWKNISESGGELMESKLRVVFETPSPSVNGGDKTFATTLQATPQKQTSSGLELELKKSTDDRKRLQKEKMELENENKQLQEKLRRLGTGQHAEKHGEGTVSTGLNMLHVLIVALVALVLGLLVGKIF